MNKSELLGWLRAEQQGWEAFLGQIGPARMDQPGVAGDWSIKDIVAHLAGWQPKLTASIQAALRGQPEPPPPWPAHLATDDDINAWIYAANRGHTVPAVLADSRQVLQQHLAAIEALPEDVRIELLHQNERVYHLLQLGHQQFPAGEFFYHFHEDHQPDILAWLARVEQH